MGIPELFSTISEKGINEHKKNILNSLDYEKNNAITNIDELVDDILNKSRYKPPKKEINVNFFNTVFRRLSFKKLISATLSLILLFAVIASASTLVGPDFDGTSTDIKGTNGENALFSNVTILDTNETDNSSLLVDQNESEENIYDQTIVDGNESSNETTPAEDVDSENTTENESNIFDGLDLSLQSDREVYFLNEPVTIQGNLICNETIEELLITLLIEAPSFNWSEIFNVTDNSFLYEFIPDIIGNYSVWLNILFENFSINGSLFFEVIDWLLNDTDGEEHEPPPDVEEPPPVIEPDIPGTPFDIFEAPENSLGASTVKVANMTYFWEYFDRYSGWYLDVWDPTSVNWVNVTQYLNVISNRSEDNQFEKISLEFTSPMTADYRLTYIIDKPVLEFNYLSDQHEYKLTFPAGHNEEYTTFFNFSDIAILPNVILDHGVKNINGTDTFWFSVQRNNILQGNTIFLDPNFGNEATSSSGWDGDDMPGGRYTMGSVGGTATSITAYILNVGQDKAGRAAIYDSSGNLLTNGVTNENTSISDGWIQFDFGTSPTLIANADYYLVVFTDSFQPELQYNSSGGNGLYLDTGETYPNFPNTYAATLQVADANPSIYCTYTEFGLPSVITNASSGVEETNATLHGYLQNNGSTDTQTWFILNNTNDFGVPLINISKGVTASQTEFSNNTAGETALTQGLLYYYKAQANNSVGWSEGVVEMFLTKPDPLTGFSATVVSSSQIDLSWSDGVGGDGAYVEYATGSAPSPWNVGDGSLVDADGNVTSPFSHSSLSAGTHYFYKAWAFASDGGWTSSGNVSAPRGDSPQTADATTLGVVPTVITNASTGVEETNATLWGYLSSNGSADTQTWFVLNNTNDFGSPLINISKGVTANQTEFSNDTTGEMDLPKGTLYYFKAQANNSGGWGEGVVEMFLTKPDPLTGFSATVVSSSQIDLSWSDGVGGDGAYVEYATGSAPSPWNVGDGSLVDADGNVTSPFSHSSLSAGTHYFYKAWAFASDGGWTSSGNVSAPRGDSPQTADATTLDLPIVVTNESTGVEETNATLWGYLSSNGSVDTTCFFLWGVHNPPTDNNVTQGIIANNTEFSYDTSGTGLLTRGTLYYFDTKASNSVGWNESGGVKTFLTKPDSPTGFIAQANSSNMIYLNWTVGTGANRTYIERNSVQNWAMGEGTEVYNDTGINYEDSGLIASTTYYYQAWSYANWIYDSTTLYQWSDSNASANAETLSGPPAVVTNESTGVEETNATLHGYLQSNGSTDTICYFLLNDTNDFGSPIFNLSKGIIADNAEFENNTAGETTLNPGTRYYYMTQANNSDGWVNGEVQSFLTKPDPLTGFSATVVSSSQIDLSWSDGVGGDGAYVEYATGSAPSPWNVGDGSLVDADGNVTSPFSHSSLSAGTHYFYKAWAFASDGGWTSSGNVSAPRGDSPQTADATTLGVVPIVTTNASTGVEETNATLWGYLSSNGSADTTCFFLWGVQNPPTDNNVTQGIIANNTEFSYDTSGTGLLTRGTLYYFDTKASNSGGWNESGGVKTFLTKPDPPSNLVAQTNDSSVIYLAWDTGTGFNTTYIERNASGQTVWGRGEGTMIYNDSGANYEDTGLTEGVTYCYQAWSYANWTYDSTTLYQWSDNNASDNNKTNNIPTIADEVPTNESTGISPIPQMSITVNDADGDSMTITWRSNATQSSLWEVFGTNVTGPDGNGTYYQTNSNFSNFSKTYYWNVSVNDGKDTNDSEIFWFSTELLTTSVDPISPYIITSSPKTITATDGSDLDKVTLYYRWSDDNQSWDSWNLLTYDGFEGAVFDWGNYTDGGIDCLEYTGGTLARQGSNAVDIQDNSGDASSFYHTSGIDVDTPGYKCIKVDFWFYFVGMETGKDFFVEYYDGSTWQNVATYVSGNDYSNGQFYHEIVWINETTYTFPTNMQIKFRADALNNDDDVYIDEIYVNATTQSAGGNGVNWTKWSNVNNPDQEYPWSWAFDFPNSTGYYEFYSIGNKSGSPNETAPASADASCRFNRIPTITNEVPANESTNIQLIPQLNITVNDADADLMTITWYSNSSGPWLAFGTNVSVPTGTYYQTNNNFSFPGKTYWWNVSVSDGVHTNESGIFHFTTSYQPSLNNPGPSNNSIGQKPMPICNVTVSDQDGGTVTVRIYENSSNGWVLQQTNNSVDVTIPANVVWDNYSNASQDFTTYWWKVNVSDGKGNYIEEIYNFRTANTSIDITPANWDQGLLAMGSTNETTGFYFNLTNEGDAALNIQINASNATNATTGAVWRLNATPDFDNFTLQYNLSGSGTWTTINLTYDTLVNNLGVGSWQTFDLKLLMAPTSTYGHPLTVTVTFRSVAS